MMMAKLSMMNKCTFVVGHFNGHSSAPRQYRQHCPMRHVQGCLRSHWMPPLGDYLLHIAPAAARATENKTTMETYTYFAGHFNGHGNAPERRRSRASLEATGGRHQESSMSNNIKETWLRQFFWMFFIVKTVEKGHGSTLRPLFIIRV